MGPLVPPPPHPVTVELYRHKKEREYTLAASAGCLTLHDAHRVLRASAPTVALAIVRFEGRDWFWMRDVGTWRLQIQPRFEAVPYQAKLTLLD